jgi:hypothetical protein
MHDPLDLGRGESGQSNGYRRTKANYLLHNRQPRQFDKMGLAKDCFELGVRTRNGKNRTLRPFQGSFD